MSCTILPKPPLFEVGKIYRTRDGSTAKIKDIILDKYALRGVVGREDHCWTFDGDWNQYGGEFGLDLMPGAIEEEKPEVIEVECQQRQIDILRREFNAQATAIAIMGATIVALDQHLNARDNGIARRIVRIESRIDGVDHRVEEMDELPLRNMLARIETSEECGRNTHQRLEGHSQQIGTLQTAQIKTFVRLAALESILVGQGLELAGKVNERLAAEGMRDACTAAADRAKPNGCTENASHTSTYNAHPKSTINGGWMNVYEAVGYADMADMTGPFSRRDWADDAARRDGRTRRACIQIPDMTEGEGL
jgi:hypothetical protein